MLASKVKVMKVKTLIAQLLVIFTIPSLTSAFELYHQEVNHKTKEGKDLIMTFDELERQEKFSIVRVKHSSGASVPSIMFVVKGCYEIAKLRKEKYFTNLKEWTDNQGNWLYKIGYTSDKSDDPKKNYGNDIDMTKDLEYMSVEDLANIFERK